MLQPRYLNYFILAIFALNVAGIAAADAAPKSKKYTRASSLPRAKSDFNMIRLFQIQSGDVLLASMTTPTDFLKRDLQVRFKKEVIMPTQGVFNLGASCALRNRDRGNSQNYLDSTLPYSSTHKIEAGTELHVQQISISPGEIRTELADSKTHQAHLELICSHPKIREWTVTSFEILNQGILELRSNIQRDPATLRSHYPAPRALLSHLEGSPWNGYFGSGLPGTSGIQLLIGSNPQAFAENGNRALWVGNRCSVLGEESLNNSDQYIKDSKFAFLGREVDSKKNKVQFRFRNWGYSLETLTIECSGKTPDVLAMTTAEVEADLNHSIHFYNK